MKLGLAQDKSALRVQVNLLPENREVVCMMGWEDIGSITFPEIKDLVIVGFANGSPNEAHVIKMLTTNEEKISAFAALGHTVRNSRPGKKNYIGSNTKVGIGRIDVEPTEPLVLGNILIAALGALADALTSTSPFAQNIPAGITVDLNPDIVTAINLFKSTYLDSASTNIASAIAFTERG